MLTSLTSRALLPGVVRLPLGLLGLRVLLLRVVLLPLRQGSLRGQSDLHPCGRVAPSYSSQHVLPSCDVRALCDDAPQYVRLTLPCEPSCGQFLSSVCARASPAPCRTVFHS